MNAVMESQLVHAHTGRVSDDSVLGSKSGVHFMDKAPQGGSLPGVRDCSHSHVQESGRLNAREYFRLVK
jgi:hypothetical protein